MVINGSENKNRITQSNNVAVDVVVVVVAVALVLNRAIFSAMINPILIMFSSAHAMTNECASIAKLMHNSHRCADVKYFNNFMIFKWPSHSHRTIFAVLKSFLLFHRSIGNVRSFKIGEGKRRVLIELFFTSYFFSSLFCQKHVHIINDP